MKSSNPKLLNHIKPPFFTLEPPLFSWVNRDVSGWRRLWKWLGPGATSPKPGSRHGWHIYIYTHVCIYAYPFMYIYIIICLYIYIYVLYIYICTICIYIYRYRNRNIEKWRSHLSNRSDTRRPSSNSPLRCRPDQVLDVLKP